MNKCIECGKDAYWIRKSKTAGQQLLCINCCRKIKYHTDEYPVYWSHIDNNVNKIIKDNSIGYHIDEIPRGELGKISKITEEYLEFIDANKQSNKVMELVELSDLLGAIDSYVQTKYNVSINDLLVMTNATKRAFESGSRKSKE